jgi:major vault protein
MSNIIKVPPYHFIWIQDGNKSVSRVEIGPQTFVLKDHETLISGDKPRRMIALDSFDNCQCKIKNPVMRDKEGNVIFDKFGQAKNNMGDTEYRTYFDKLYSEPFALFPKEELVLQ